MTIVSAAIISLALCAAMLVFLELGYRTGRVYFGKNVSQDGLNLFQGAIFALLGLLLGFAFSGSMSRLEARRDLIVREANATNTAFLRIAMLPSVFQPQVRDLFHSYLEARLQAYAELDSGGDFAPLMKKASQLQQQIWIKAIEATERDSGARSLVLSSLNGMIEVTTARTVALRTQMPALILVLLLGVALLTSLLAGYGMARSGHRHVFHGAIYAAAVSLTIYVILDIDNPRIGLIRLDAAEDILRQLYQSI